jgi:glycosyltransferase involved in cell wall biosynthesis
MPVFDARDYVEEAVHSVTSQSLGSFELLIYENGCTDDSPEILERLANADPRIALHRVPRDNYAVWLRDGVERARAPLIARMDADDVAHPERLARQAQYLRAHPECVGLGTEAMFVDPERRPLATCGVRVDHASIDRELLRGRGIALVHPAAMLRREAVLAVGNYRTDVPWAEDLDLWLRLSEHGRLANLPEILLEYRQHPAAVNASRAAEQRTSVERILREARERRGLRPTTVTLPRMLARPEPADHWLRWCRLALGGRQLGTARLYACKLLRTRPLRLQSWRWMARVLLDPVIERARRRFPREPDERAEGAATPTDLPDRLRSRAS